MQKIISARFVKILDKLESVKLTKYAHTLQNLIHVDQYPFIFYVLLHNQKLSHSMALILNIHAVLDEFPQPLFPNPQNHLLTTTHTCQEVGSLSELEKVEVLGKGREGTVYKVRHKNTGAVYALKVVYAAYSSNNIHDVLQEIEIHGSLDSPFVVGFHGVFEEPSGDVAILMDLMDFGTLDSMVKTNGTFSETMIAHVARQTLMGLDYLHNTKKIVHCDIKPSNLLVNQDMQIRIADFGVSKKVILNSISDSGSNDPPHLVGTIAYMSPERFDASGCMNGTSFDVFAGDVWSLGLTLMEMYIGYQPYCPPGRQFTTEFDLIADICFEDPPRLPQEASEDFQDFIRCCLHKEITKRWTAAQLLSHPFLNN